MKKTVLLLSLLFLSLNAFAAEKPIKVVATTTFIADLMRKVGGEHVSVESIASPKFNIHFIQPTPNDVRKTSRADLFAFMGLDLEAWADPLLEAAGNPKLFRGGEHNLDLSSGITLLNVPSENITRAQGDMHLFGNPHYTMSPENVLIMANTVSLKLSEMDPAHAADYAKNKTDFEAKMRQKIEEWKSFRAAISGNEIFSQHKDIEYFSNFMGLKTEMFIEPKPGIPPTPKHLAKLEAYARDKNVHVIVMPSYYPRGNANKLAKKIGATVVVLVQNPGEIKGTEDIFDFYAHNVKAIVAALKSN